MKTSYLFAGGLVAVFLILGGVYAFTQKEETAYPSIENEQNAGVTQEPSGVYTAAEVASHANAQSCWTIINGTVYDLTKWITAHPGGERGILSICGKDGTAAFEGKHGGQERPEETLTDFAIGTLAS